MRKVWKFFWVTMISVGILHLKRVNQELNPGPCQPEMFLTDWTHLVTLLTSVENRGKLNEYETAPNFIELTHNLTSVFVDLAEFTCFYQFLHDVIIKLFCRSKQNKFWLNWIMFGAVSYSLSCKWVAIRICGNNKSKAKKKYESYSNFFLQRNLHYTRELHWFILNPSFLKELLPNIFNRCCHQSLDILRNFGTKPQARLRIRKIWPRTRSRLSIRYVLIYGSL